MGARAAVLAGVVVGAVLVATVAAFDDPDRPPVPGLLAAYERSRTGTYVITELFERRLFGGRTFNSEITTAQRPPDRLVDSGAVVEGRVGDQRVACARSGDEPLRCRHDRVARSYAAEVAEDVRLLRALVEGPAAAYAVENAGTGCWTLVLRGRLLAPPYGEDALWCFDPRTGAPLRSVVHRAEATDTRRTLDLRARPTDADFRLPA
jgi:hypothetical protein